MCGGEAERVRFFSVCFSFLAYIIFRRFQSSVREIIDRVESNGLLNYLHIVCVSLFYESAMAFFYFFLSFSLRIYKLFLKYSHYTHFFSDFNTSAEVGHFQCKVSINLPSWTFSFFAFLRFPPACVVLLLASLFNLEYIAFILSLHPRLCLLFHFLHRPSFFLVEMRL